MAANVGFFIQKKIPPQNPRSHPDPKHQVSVVEGGRGRFPPVGKDHPGFVGFGFHVFRRFRPDGFWGTPGEIREVCVCGKFLDLFYVYIYAYVRKPLCIWYKQYEMIIVHPIIPS